MSLATGQILTAKSWTVLPISQDVIERVHNLARTGCDLNSIMFEKNSHTPILNNSAINANNTGLSEDDDFTYRSSDSVNNSNLSNNSSGDSEDIESDNDDNDNLSILDPVADSNRRPKENRASTLTAEVS